MEATSNYKNIIKNLFLALEPEGNGKVHKDTLKRNMKKMLVGNVMDDKGMEKMIEYMSPDKDGMISSNSYLKLFSMPQFSAEEAAATRKILKKWPELLDGLMDSKKVAAKLGYDKPQEVEKIVGQIKNCYLENLERRLKKEPPKDNNVVREKEAQLLKAMGQRIGRDDNEETNKSQ